MDTATLITVIVLSAVGAFLCFTFALAFLCDKIAFGIRYDKNPLLKYLTAEDFDLAAEEVSVNQGDFSLNGYI